jgi:thiamine biosynthesis lipoprotein
MMLRLATHAMGTRFELVLDADGEARGRAAGEAALEVVERCDHRWSAFGSDSLVARANREAAERPVKLDGETFELLEECLELRAKSDGAFDVAIGASMSALGFRDAPPSHSAAAGGAFELDRATQSVRFAARDTRIDLGSVAKGHALDLAAAELRAAGIERALLHGGTSSVIAIGAPPGATGWRVQLGAHSRISVLLADRALSCSAPRGRTAMSGGRTLGHILDPRSGAPLELDVDACVLADTARTADAWSTAALVLCARSADFAARFPSDCAVLVRRDATDLLRLDPRGEFFSEVPLEPIAT